jgi:hypothetical protein
LGQQDCFLKVAGERRRGKETMWKGEKVTRSGCGCEVTWTFGGRFSEVVCFQRFVVDFRRITFSRKSINNFPENPMNFPTHAKSDSIHPSSIKCLQLSVNLLSFIIRALFNYAMMNRPTNHIKTLRYLPSRPHNIALQCRF